VRGRVRDGRLRRGPRDSPLVAHFWGPGVREVGEARGWEGGEDINGNDCFVRGATANNLNDLESTIDDRMNLIGFLLRDRRLVTGGGGDGAGAGEAGRYCMGIG
jgi:hypothetical protein